VEVAMMFIYYHTGLQVTALRTSHFCLDEAKALHEAGLIVYGIWPEGCAPDEDCWEVRS
jgi:hypothetical protein